MIEIVKGLPDKVVGIVARGRVTNEECDSILRPAIENSRCRHDKLRLYYQIDARFPGAGWGDLDVAIDQLPQWQRIAVVSDDGRVRQIVNALRFLIASEVRVFTTEEASQARAWIAIGRRRARRRRIPQDHTPAAECPKQHDDKQYRGDAERQM